MAGWATIDNLYREELKQRREEGCDVDAFIKTHPGVPEDLPTLNRWYDELMALPVDPSFPYEEPVSYTHLDVYKRQMHRCKMASFFSTNAVSPPARTMPVRQGI